MILALFMIPKRLLEAFNEVLPLLMSDWNLDAFKVKKLRSQSCARPLGQIEWLQLNHLEVFNVKIHLNNQPSIVLRTRFRHTPPAPLIIRLPPARTRLSQLSSRPISHFSASHREDLDRLILIRPLSSDPDIKLLHLEIIFTTTASNPHPDAQ